MPKKNFVIFNLSIIQAIPKLPKRVKETATTVKSIPDGSNENIGTNGLDSNVKIGENKSKISVLRPIKLLADLSKAGK